MTASATWTEYILEEMKSKLDKWLGNPRIISSQVADHRFCNFSAGMPHRMSIPYVRHSKRVVCMSQFSGFKGSQSLSDAIVRRSLNLLKKRL